VLDSRGNLRAAVNGSGVVRERRSLSATGLPLQVDPDTGSLTSVLFPGIDPEPSASDSGLPSSAHGLPLLTGHAWDPYAQGHYAWHRWISPLTTGRFTSHSPLTYPVAELNYEWVFNNGWDGVDP
jgi:hypothetical protein